MNQVFIDIRGVLVQAHIAREPADRAGNYAEQHRCSPVPGAIEGLRALMADQPAWLLIHLDGFKGVTAMHLMEWVSLCLPDFCKRMIVTPDMRLVGDEADYLIERTESGRSSHVFRGSILPFSEQFHWPQLREFFEELRRVDQELTEDAD